MSISVTDSDTLIQRLINGVTDFVEGECNRRFKEDTYTNEVYTIHGGKREFVFLKQAPVSVLTTLEYRAGTPGNPNYTAFIRDNYELLEAGKSGIIKIFGGVPRGIDSIRATYTAGYKINFANAGDAGDTTPTHTLPADLSDLCERLVVRWFKKRDQAGKESQAFEGGTITWKDLLDSEDRDTIARYVRLAPFV